MSASHKTTSPAIDLPQLNDSIKRVIAQHFDRSPESIGDNDDLVNDIGCDSLDIIEIAMNLEEELGMPVPDEVSEARTVRQISQRLAAIMEQRGAAG